MKKINRNKLLVIVVTYNGMKWLDKCFSSVIKSSIPADLFIVDNGSTDGTIDFIKQNYDNSILIESKENLGFGRANNLGLKYAIDNEYDFVYLLNQDAWIESNTYEKLIGISLKNPDFGIISPLQVNKEKTRLDSNLTSQIPSDLFSDLLCNNSKKEIYDINAVMAAHWLITQRCLKDVGGFSPAFKHYGEDDNYLQRAKKKGYRIGVVPQVFGIHDREYRACSIQKRKYLHYISNLIILNNPLLSHRLIRVINNTLTKAFLYPKELSVKYLIQLIVDYCKSVKYRKKYEKKLMFLEYDKPE